jgi:hypothetical protein
MFFEMSVDYQWTAWRYTSEDRTFHCHQLAERLAIYSSLSCTFTRLQDRVWKHSNEDNNSGFILIRGIVLWPPLPAYLQFRSGGRDSLHNEVHTSYLNPRSDVHETEMKVAALRSAPNLPLILCLHQFKYVNSTNFSGDIRMSLMNLTFKNVLCNFECIDVGSRVGEWIMLSSI